MDCKIFVHVDVETTGPNPFSYDMVSLGAAAFVEPMRGFPLEPQLNDEISERVLREHDRPTSLFDERTIARRGKNGFLPAGLIGTFYSLVEEPYDGWNFEPSTKDWWDSARVSDEAAEELTRLPREGKHCTAQRLVSWLGCVAEFARSNNFVFVASPSGFDWMFVVEILDSEHLPNPFGYFPMCMGSVLYGANMDDKEFPKWGPGSRRIIDGMMEDSLEYGLCLHHALDDAELSAYRHATWLRETGRFNSFRDNSTNTRD